MAVSRAQYATAVRPAHAPAPGPWRPPRHQAKGRRAAARSLYLSSRSYPSYQSYPSCCLWSSPLVDLAHDQKDRERDDEELEHVLDECAVGDDGLAAFASLVQPEVGRLPRQGNVFVFQVDAVERNRDDGHDQIVHNRVHDLAERRADDDANGQVERVALVHEVLEFLEHAGLRLRQVGCPPTLDECGAILLRPARLRACAEAEPASP